MSDDLVELDFCCPECNCSQWQRIDEDAEIYCCGRCDYVVSFDGPRIYDDQDRCSKCNGGGLIEFDGELICCPQCNGSGSD